MIRRGSLGLNRKKWFALRDDTGYMLLWVPGALGSAVSRARTHENDSGSQYGRNLRLKFWLRNCLGVWVVSCLLDWEWFAFSDKQREREKKYCGREIHFPNCYTTYYSKN